MGELAYVASKGIRELSVLSVRFCSESKMSLKITSIQKQISKPNEFKALLAVSSYL